MFSGVERPTRSSVYGPLGRDMCAAHSRRDGFVEAVIHAAGELQRMILVALRRCAGLTDSCGVTNPLFYILKAAVTYAVSRKIDYTAEVAIATMQAGRTAVPASVVWIWKTSIRC